MLLAETSAVGIAFASSVFAGFVGVTVLDTLGRLFAAWQRRKAVGSWRIPGA